MEMRGKCMVYLLDESTMKPLSCTSNIPSFVYLRPVLTKVEEKTKSGESSKYLLCPFCTILSRETNSSWK